MKTAFVAGAAALLLGAAGFGGYELWHRSKGAPPAPPPNPAPAAAPTPPPSGSPSPGNLLASVSGAVKTVGDVITQGMGFLHQLGIG